MKSTRTTFCACVVFAGVLAGCGNGDQKKGNTRMKGSVQRLNPDGLRKNPA
jgi:hypothetical protein